MYAIRSYYVAPAADIDQGDLPFELARAISAPFIVAEEYGTRCTTVLTWNRGGEVSVMERRFDSGGRQSGESRFRFSASGSQAAA